jgi:hypothetical protein
MEDLERTITLVERMSLSLQEMQIGLKKQKGVIYFIQVLRLKEIGRA